MTKTKIDPLTDWKGFYEEFQNESERGMVILAGAFLDAQLRNLISKFLIDDKNAVDKLLGTEKSYGPLNTFDSRIKIAYCLGLISKLMHEDLIAFKNIRNPFAHKMHGYSFDEPDINKFCSKLKLANMMTDAIPDLPNLPREKFLLCVFQLANWIALKTFEIEVTQRSVPSDQKVGQIIRTNNEAQ